MGHARGHRRLAIDVIPSLSILVLDLVLAVLTGTGSEIESVAYTGTRPSIGNTPGPWPKTSPGIIFVVFHVSPPHTV